MVETHKSSRLGEEEWPDKCVLAVGQPQGCSHGDVQLEVRSRQWGVE